MMSYIGLQIITLLVPLTTMCESAPSLRSISEVEVRRNLDEITQHLVMGRDSNYKLYHSYIFNSGVGNREELVVNSMKRDDQFAAGEAVLSWQSVQSAGRVYLLGRKLTSVSLLVSHTQLSSDRTAHFSEHWIDVGAKVSGTSLFTKLDPVSTQTDTVAVVATESSTADILWYKVVDQKLEKISSWARYKKTSAISAVKIGKKYCLIVVEDGSPASVDVFDVIFSSDGTALDFRLLQNFPLASSCSEVTACHVGQQVYLLFTQPSSQALTVYTTSAANPSQFQYHVSLTLPHISHVTPFTLANQQYLVVNGQAGYVFRLTEVGDFVAELSLGPIDEWLAIPIHSYRSDVLLFSKSNNITNMFVWAGFNKGFKTVSLPQCDSCLEGEWRGAVSLPLRSQNCLLLPRPPQRSSLLTLTTSLQDVHNPVIQKFAALRESMKHIEKKLHLIRLNISRGEEMLKHTIKPNTKNIITAKWTLGKLETPELQMNTMMQPATELNSTNELLASRTEVVDVATLESLVRETVNDVEGLVDAVEKKNKEIWSLENFKGKITFKGNLIVDNLTISSLNSHSMNDILQNTFRKDKPKTIKGNKVVESVKVENIFFNKINRFTHENLKFNHKLMLLRGNFTFISPLKVDGDISLAAGGTVNGLDLSELCEGEKHCTVLPKFYIDNRGKDFGKTSSKASELEKSLSWDTVIGGKNLTVLKLNGVDWGLLSRNVVYRNAYHQVPGTTVVKGTLKSDTEMWTGEVEDYHPESRGTYEGPDILQMQPSRTAATSSSRKVEEDVLVIPPHSNVIFTDLEVIGKVTCSESEWGASAADVLLADPSTIEINAEKTFNGEVNVSGNLEVKGLVGGVNVSELFTKDDQIFYGPTTLHGNITIGSATLSGYWDGVNISSPSNGNTVHMKEVHASRITVLETLNGIPVSDLVFTDNNRTFVKQLFADTVDVTGDITVHRKVCSQNLTEFNKARLSITKEQIILENYEIDSANITRNFNVEKQNDVDIFSISGRKHNSENDIIHLSALHVEGNITTDLGLNGYNLSQLAANAVWLHSNNNIKGLLTFKDEVTFNMLESQGFLNQKLYGNGFNDADVVYKHNTTVILSGSKTFLNSLTISEDLYVEEINGNDITNILTKNSEQEIKGDVIVDGDVSVTDETTVLGLLNSQNITEFGHRCSLSGNTISCKGDAVFKSEVSVDHFNCEGDVNGVNITNFVESLVNIHNPDVIMGFKNFTGKTLVKDLMVRTINNQDWDEFLLDAVIQNSQEEVESSVIFTEKLTVGDISVNYNLDADSINKINLDEWKNNAIYLNNSIFLKRGLHLTSASSKGNVSLVTYGDLDMEGDVIRLNAFNDMTSLWVKSVNVTGKLDMNRVSVNKHNLAQLHADTLKVSGYQIVSSDLVFLGDVLITGNVTTLGKVNNRNIQDAVNLVTDQVLHGKYKFDCIKAKQNISTSGLLSGVDISEWAEKAVLKGSEGEVEGAWSVTDRVWVSGPVSGRGHLADLDLAELSSNITRNILDVHHNMKANLSQTCTETNHQLSLSRNQSRNLLYLDESQEIAVPNEVSFMTHFKSGMEDYLSVSEKKCTTTLYKWDSNRGLFTQLITERFGLATSQLIAVRHKQLTYLVTVSSDLPSDCLFTGAQLWLFNQDQLKYISPVDLGSNTLHGYKEKLYSINSTGVFKWQLSVINENIVFQRTQIWTIETGGMSFLPQEAGVGLALSGPSGLVSLDAVFDLGPKLYSNCTGEVHSIAANPTNGLIALATTEKTQVPRYSDHVKVYRLNGELFDKLPARHASHLLWFPVPDQVWLAFMQNHSELHLFHLQGPIEGFQLKISANIEATRLSTLALPVDTKVNPQPLLILQTSASVKVLRAVLKGDPYLGPDINCNFDDDLITVPTL